MFQGPAAAYDLLHELPGEEGAAAEEFLTSMPVGDEGGEFLVSGPGVPASDTEGENNNVHFFPATGLYVIIVD